MLVKFQVYEEFALKEAAGEMTSKREGKRTKTMMMEFSMSFV